MDVGLKIKEKRKEAGLTQAQLAKLSGVATISIRQYESGKRQPRMEQLQKIAKALEIPITQLLSVYEQIGLAAREYFSSETNEGRSRQLHNSFDILSEDNQAKVIDYSYTLLKAELYEEYQEEESRSDEQEGEDNGE